MTPQRINLWERKLLDLTLANALINTRYGESCLQLQNTAAEEFYNAFLSCQQMALVPADEKHQGLQSVLEVDTMCKVAKSIMRTAYSNLSESGSEQLFLAFGMLHWRENPDPFHPMTEQKMHQAPAVLVPVHISRQRITGVYYIHPTGEEPMVNITLIELLKQQHERDLSKLIPQNGGAIQFAKVMADFRKVADSKECWSFDEAVCVGLFSFSKFVMWNDIHTNAEKMREAYVVESLVQKRMMYSDSIPNSDVRQLDVESKPFDMALPLDADSSQIEPI